MEKVILNKAGRARGGTVSEQAERIWGMLDELATENPNAYKRFLETNLKEGKELFAPPTPYGCFRTKYLASGDKLYINIASYDRLRKPNPNSDIPTLAGDILDGFSYENERVHCVVVAFHPNLIEQVKGCAEDESDLAAMVIRMLQDKKKVSISFEYEKCKEEFVGLQSMLGDISRLANGMKPISRVPDAPQSVPTLEQISRLARHGGDTEENDGISPHIKPSGPSQPLVTEINSSPSSSSSSSSSPPAANGFTHRIVIRSPSLTRPKRAVFIASLPDAADSSEISVEVSKEVIKVVAGQHGSVCVPWPVKINERTAIASFTKSKQLVVKAPLL